MEVINLNLIPTGALPVVHASQYDEGRTFGANLMDGSTVYTLDGTEVLECDVKKPDGNIVTVAVTNTSDSFITIDTTLQMCACAGESLAELHITKGAQEIGTLNFILAVERSPLEGGIQSDSGIHNLQTQIGEAVAEQYAAEDVVFDAAPVAGHGTGFAVTSEGVKTYVEGEIAALTIPEELDDLSDVEITTPTNGEILIYNNGVFENQANPASTANFAADYDDTATYNTNDKVIYQGLYYIALEDSITGAWDPTKWDLTTVSALTGETLPLTTNPADGTVSEAIGEKADYVLDGSHIGYGIWGDWYYAAGRIFVPFPNADKYTFVVTDAKYVSGATQMTDITSSTTFTLANELGVLFATTTNAACGHYGTVTFTAIKN